MNSIDSAHADLVPASPTMLLVSTPDRMLFIIGSDPPGTPARQERLGGRFFPSG